MTDTNTTNTAATSISAIEAMRTAIGPLLNEFGERQWQSGHGVQHKSLEDAFEAVIERAALAAPAQPVLTDAYVGAREDLAIWKKRALEAEALNRKFAASVNGPTFMGEPSAQAAPVDASVQRDADRYRWLKITAKPGEPYELFEKMREAFYLVRAYEQFCKPWNGWDATIDAARAAQEGK